MRGLAVDPSNNLYEIIAEGPVKFNSSNGVAEYKWGDIDGAEGGGNSRLGANGGHVPSDLAFDPVTGNLLFSETETTPEIGEYDLSGELSWTPLSTFGSGYLSESAAAIAVSSSGKVYAVDTNGDRVVVFEEGVLPNVTTEGASSVTETDATLNGIVGPSEQAVTGCEFEYITEAGRKEHFVNEEQTVAVSGASGGDFTLTFEGATTAPIAWDEGAGGVSHALAELPTIENSSNVEVTGENGGPFTIKFQGGLAHTDPHQLTADASGLTPPSGSSVTPTVTTAVITQGGNGWETAAVSPCSPEADQISPNAVEVPVSGHVTGLSPDTTYDYRLRAEDAQGPNTGAMQSFTTLSPLSFGGESFYGVGPGSVTLAAEILPGGRAVEYQFEYGTSENYGLSTPKVEVEHGHSAVHVHTQVSDLQPDTVYHFRILVTDEEGVHQGTDLTFSTFPAPVGSLPDNRAYELVTPVQNDEADVYLEESWPAAKKEGVFTYNHPFRASANGERVAYESGPTVGGNGQGGFGLGNAQLATRSATGGWTQVNIQPTAIPSAKYQSLSGDLSNGVLNSEAPLVLGGPGSNQHPGYYLWSANGGGYQALPGEERGESVDGSSVLTEASGHLSEVVDGKISPVGVLPNGQVAGQSHAVSPRDAISADGSRVIWRSEEGGSKLYMRDMRTGETVQLDAAQGGPGGGKGKFWAASSDGSKVFFTDEERLTSDSTAGGNESEIADLYECEMVLKAGKLVCKLFDLTVDSEGPANVQGVLGVSPNGEYLYFVAAGVLAKGATPQECVEYSTTLCNLYVDHDGTTSFVATLSSEAREDHSDWERNSFYVQRAATAQVSGDGSLLFKSNQSLTGYDNVGPDCINNSGELSEGACEEVYVYDPGAGDGRIFCASCDPSGEPPDPGVSGAGENGGSVLPLSGSKTYQMRWVSEDGGRVFFDSSERLVARDTNGKQDVYEWERNGTGSCTEEAGCIYLLSSGSGVSDSYLLDASANGNDVFIISRDPLI